MKRTVRFGFTLVELMIVITVIAILATIAIVSFTRIQKQARDTKRKAEVKSIQTALQAYFTEKNTYPVSTSPSSANAVLSPVLLPNYISSVPLAPKGSAGTNTDYTFVTNADGSTYGICVDLETATDPLKPMWYVNTNNAAGAEIADAACTPQ